MSKTIQQTMFSTDFPPFKELVQLPFSLISGDEEEDEAMSVGEYNAAKSKPYKVLDIHVINIYFPLESTGGTVEGTLTFKDKETKIVYTIRWFIDHQEWTRKIYSTSLDGSLSADTFVATYRI